MTLNVGQDFKKRWLDAPEAVRQTFVDDLHRICDLLHFETDTQLWLSQDQQHTHLTQLKIKQAYADLKAELTEAIRNRKQLVLENKLAKQRAQQQADQLALQNDEIQQFESQTTTLLQLRQQIDQEISQYCEKFTQNPKLPAIDYSNRQFVLVDEKISSELESIRLRLELEAETLIEQTVNSFRSKLQAAAKDEIEYILANSNFSAEK